MKFKEKYSDIKYMDMADNNHLVGDKQGCLVCGDPTEFIEVCSESHFCSDECEEVFYKQVEDQEYHNDTI